MKKLMMLVLAGMFSAGMASANEGGGEVDFSKLDQDGDGQLSRTEVAQDSELAAQFSTIDADGDGYLAETEVQDASMEDTGMQDTSGQEQGVSGEEQSTEEEEDTGEDY